MFCRIIEYTFEDDITLDPDKEGFVMLAWEESEQFGREQILDNIPAGEAWDLCNLINSIHSAI